MIKRRQRLQSKRVSGVVGAVLLGLGCLWLGWLLLGQHNTSGSGSFVWPIVGANVAPTDAPVPQLVAAGISTGPANGSAALNQQQAMAIANGLEPDASANARTSNAKYVLLNYVPTGSSSHGAVTNTPVWMILYQHIPVTPNSASVDPVPSTRTYHDLYVFIDANSGKEVLTVWI